MKLTPALIQEAFALDPAALAQKAATLFRLASEDIIENFDSLDAEIEDDDSLVITFPDGVQLVVGLMDEDNSYTCQICYDGQSLLGGFTLLNDADADRLDSLFL